MSKQYNVKILARDGTILKTLSPKVLGAEPKFTNRINSISGAITLELNSKFDNFGEGEYIDFMNIVEVYSVALKSGTQIETLIFKGYIEEYRPYIDSSKKEGIQIVVQHIGALLSRSYVADYLYSADPSAIFKSIIDNFNTIYGGNLITYTLDSIEDTGATVTVNVIDKRHSEAIQQVFETSLADWYYYIDAIGVFHFHPKPSTATHTFTISKDIKSISASKSIKETINHIILKHKYYNGSTYLDTTTNYNEAISQAALGTGSPAMGKLSNIISVREVYTQDTADGYADKKFQELASPVLQAEITVTEPYNIDSIKVGDTCKIVNINSSFFTNNMQIVQVDYSATEAKITVGSFKNDLQSALRKAIRG